MHATLRVGNQREVEFHGVQTSKAEESTLAMQISGLHLDECAGKAAAYTGYHGRGKLFMALTRIPILLYLKRELWFIVMM